MLVWALSPLKCVFYGQTYWKDNVRCLSYFNQRVLFHRNGFIPNYNISCSFRNIEKHIYRSNVRF